MKLHFYILIITIALLYDIYYDNYYSKMIKVNKKYITMAGYGLLGIVAFYVVKQNNKHSSNIVQSLSTLVHFMPIDKNASSFISPLLDLTSSSGFDSSLLAHHPSNVQMMEQNPGIRRMMESGTNQNGGRVKRSVSETKKKYVASQQYWKCKNCSEMLDATFEVDHVVELQNGGSNHVTNLVALCRNCHGKKTMLSHL